MKKILKTTALILSAVTLLSSSVFAEENRIPLRATFEENGFTVTWHQETLSVSLEKDGFKHTEAVGDRIQLDYDTTYISREAVDEIFADYYKEMLSSSATVKEVGEGYILASSDKLGEVIFTVDENTNIHHEKNRMLYKLTDITADMKLKVYYSEAMTASLPPQTYATEVIILNLQEEPEVELSQVFTVSEKGEGYILASNETMGEVMFTVDETTLFRHEMNRRLYTLSDVEAGIKLQITFEEAMTASLPPRVHATDVVFLNDAEAEEATESEALTTSGTIVAVGEDYFTVAKEDGSRVRFNVDENTNIHHAINKRIYKLSDLEEELEVDVIHADAMTFSLPPQAYAMEVIIK